jgi:hypothetical protein
MRMRLKTKWRDKDRNRSLDDNAVALASNIWRIAVACAKNLHEQDYVYESDGQRLAVVSEYLAFLVHLSDRLTAAQMVEEERVRFVTAVARAVTRHLHDNQTDLIGPGNHGTAFIALLNERSRDYAEMPFDAEMASYSALRYLAEKIQALMGSEQVNRWIAEQVIEIDGPEAVENLRQGVGALYGTTPRHVPMSIDPDQ